MNSQINISTKKKQRALAGGRPKETARKCNKCSKALTDRQNLTCAKCKYIYHLNCTEVTFQRYKIMDQERKKAWKCAYCWEKYHQEMKANTDPSPKSVEKETPENIIVTPLPEHTSEPNVPKIPSVECTPNHTFTETPQNYVTERNKIVINVSTENSFSSLTTDEDLDDIHGIMNRSCPEINTCTRSYIQELNEKIGYLQEKLVAADTEINEILLENGAMKKKLSEYEIKIKQLTDICRSTSAIKPIHASSQKKKNRKKNVNRHTLDFSVTDDTELVPQCNSSSLIDKNMKEQILTNLTPETDELNSLQQTAPGESRLQNDKLLQNEPTKSRRRVLLLADENGAELRNLLDKYLGEEFHLKSILKPSAPLEEVLNGGISDCKDFTKSDYVIILAGSHDKNPVKFQSTLQYCVNVLKDTNILFGKIYNNKYLSVNKLNNMLKSINNNFDNIHISELIHTYRNKIHRLNSCRSLIMDIILVDYKNKCKREKSNNNSFLGIKSQTYNRSTQTDETFFRDQLGNF